MTIDPWVPFLLGQVLGDYRLDAYRGGGAFGVTFEATNTSTGSRFGVKVLPPGHNAQAVAEFDREGLLLQKLMPCSGVVNWVESQTAVLPLRGPGSAAPVPMAFKYHVLTLGSGSLDELILDPTDRAAVPWKERLAHWRGAIKGAHQMHLRNVAHRDLKSDNCLLMVSGNRTEVRLIDLGRSRDFHEPALLPPQAYIEGRGDPRHAPPEHLWCQGGSTENDCRCADLYGLGSVLVELATGHPMTALAMGSWEAAKIQGLRDLGLGVRRDLGVLRPGFHRAIDQLSSEFPPAIRQEAVKLTKQLCDPVPAERQPRRPTGKRHVPDNGLEWLLRRADILSRTLDTSGRRCGPKKSERRSVS